MVAPKHYSVGLAMFITVKFQKYNNPTEESSVGFYLLHKISGTQLSDYSYTDLLIYIYMDLI